MVRKVFTPDDPALPMNYPGFVFRVLSEQGYPPALLLSDTGLEEMQLQDPHFRCGFQPLRRLLLNAIEQTGQQHLGITLALKFQATYIGLPAYTAMNAATFRDGIRVLEKFFFLNFPAFEVRLADGRSGLGSGEAAIALLSKFPFGNIEYFGFSSAIVAMNGLLKAMLRIERVASRAEMTVPTPDRWEEIEPMLGFPIGFGAARNRIVFPQPLLDLPLPGSDPINHPRLVALCEQFASEFSFETTPVSQVAGFLETLQVPNASLSEAAAALGYSERGLRRHLERSGTTYRDMVAEICERRARDLLQNSNFPIKTIADKLGFDSPSNFARSFKRWTGDTPKAFRERVQAKGGAGPN